MVQDNESKRRRLTSESTGGLLPRGIGEACHSAEVVQLAAYLPDSLARSKLVHWGVRLKAAQPKVRAAATSAPGLPHTADLLAPRPEALTLPAQFSPRPSLTPLLPSPCQVHVSEHLIECGLCLFRHLRIVQSAAALDGRLPLHALRNDVLCLHDLAACWWIGLKCCSVRTAVPNRALMSKATDCYPAMLGDRELAALLTLEWDANALLREAGLIQ